MYVAGLNVVVELGEFNAEPGLSRDSVLQERSHDPLYSAALSVAGVVESLYTHSGESARAGSMTNPDIYDLTSSSPRRTQFSDSSAQDIGVDLQVPVSKSEQHLFRSPSGTILPRKAASSR